MSRLPKKEADARLGGLTALAKARAGMVLQTCAECAMLLFGGNGYTRSGLGEVVEMLWREVGVLCFPLIPFFSRVFCFSVSLDSPCFQPRAQCMSEAVTLLACADTSSLRHQGSGSPEAARTSCSTSPCGSCSRTTSARRRIWETPPNAPNSNPIRHKIERLE